MTQTSPSSPLTLKRVDNSHAYIYEGDKWVLTARMDLAERILKWLEEERKLNG